MNKASIEVRKHSFTVASLKPFLCKVVVLKVREPLAKHVPTGTRCRCAEGILVEDSGEVSIHIRVLFPSRRDGESYSFENWYNETDFHYHFELAGS